MSITFYLVRHALKEKMIGDVPITEAGIRQAHLTAQYFSNIPVTAVYASPLRRARETAEAIHSRTGTELHLDHRLRERANWGDLPGQSFEEFVEMWERCIREPEYSPPVGDSAKQAAQRLSSLLQELAGKYPPDSRLVIVTHGGLITDYLVNSFSEPELTPFHPNFIAEQMSLVSECSITSVIYDGEKRTISDFAAIEHLNHNG